MKHVFCGMASLAAVALAARVGGQAPATPANQGGAPAATPGIRYHDDGLRYGKAASEAPAGIAWGPGREVQAGVVLMSRYGRPDQHTGLYVFAIYLRNRTNRPLTVSSQSFGGLSVPADEVDYLTMFQSKSIYCSPTVRDRDGKAVDVAFKLGTERLKYSLKPGEVAQVSHWMLRTKAPKMKGVGSWSNTQVAFVETGKYRVACDLNASWGEKGDQQVALRTGETGFEVIKADLDQ